MPYKYIYMEPEVAYFTKHNGKEIVIYKTYDEDDYDSPFEYWFTLDSDTCGCEYAYEFDIREFDEYYTHLSIEENFDILVMKGYITNEGWRYDLKKELKKHMAG